MQDSGESWGSSVKVDFVHMDRIVRQWVCEWVREWVVFNVSINTLQVISETSPLLLYVFDWFQARVRLRRRNAATCLSGCITPFLTSYYGANRARLLGTFWRRASWFAMTSAPVRNARTTSAMFRDNPTQTFGLAVPSEPVRAIAQPRREEMTTVCPSPSPVSCAADRHARCGRRIYFLVLIIRSAA